MLKQTFQDQKEFDLYMIEQKRRQDNHYLTVSERKDLTKMLSKDYKPTFIVEKNKIPLVTNINELRKPCVEVTKEDNIREIIQQLKDALDNGGLGITANQIGIQKRISYLKIPKITQDKKLEFQELILINAKIVEKERPIKINNEGCLSFPGIDVTTKRYVFITVEYLNEKLELQTGTLQDIEALASQHEIDHQNGVTIFERKWKPK